MKPELLLPAGNTEAFHAALKGGADAIYLGLQDFNARKRANNFTLQQLPALLDLAHKQNTKVFITLNIVIKNEELPQLYILLFQLSHLKVDAVIIQDWGVFHLIKKHFPKLEVHASTQMAFHNSVGANFGAKSGLNRIILARELTLNELQTIRKNSKVDLELFVHGALCYSFSGLCLFSSYLGGMSANRGACKQPCRRMYHDNKKQHYIFNLKDYELIELIPEICKMGINSLKIEGRMKSADYVYTIAKAYRTVIDDNSKIKEAKRILQHDIGREKTAYFMGGNVSESITETPNTGQYAGKVEVIGKEGFDFSSRFPLEEIKRIRVCSTDRKKQINLKLKNAVQKDGLISVTTDSKEIFAGDLVYISGFSGETFSSKLPNLKTKFIKLPNINEAINKTSQLLKPAKTPRIQIFLRIDSLAWLRKIRLENIDFLILNLPFKEWSNLPLESKFLANNRDKLIAEFPKFIMEDKCSKYKKLATQLNLKGISKFMVSHISQIELIPHKAALFTNENVYTFNDAAIAQLKKFGIQNHVYPLENDLINLIKGKDRSGIVPLYFTPQLFYSRMPIKTQNEKGELKDDTNIDFHVEKKDGMTITLPNKPVSLLQNKSDLIKKGFKQFLIDVSYTTPSQNTFKTLIRRYFKGEQIQPSTSFNFRKGLS